MEIFLDQARLFLNNNYYLLVIIGAVIFSLHTRSKAFFLSRLLLGTAVSYLINYLLLLALAAMRDAFTMHPMFLILSQTVSVLIMYAASVAVIRFSYEYSVRNAAYMCLLGYAIQHMTVLIFNIIEYYLLPAGASVARAAIYLLLFTIAYSLCYVFARKHQGEFINKSNLSVILQSAVFLFGSVILGSLSYYDIILNSNLAGTPVAFVVSAFGVMICTNILVGLLDSFHIRKMEAELNKTRELWKQDVHRYELSRDVIEVLNIRYHDLKKRMSLALKDSSAMEDAMKAIDDYDDSIRTGNEAMDVVLTEKSVLCRQNGIALMCMADGNCLTGMGAVDIYSVLGNLIENAIEYLGSIEDSDKRVIRLDIRRRLEMDMIRIENYLEQPLEVLDGVPETTKDDKENHGFGLKSVRYTLKKYNGLLRISTDNHLFAVTVAIPRRDAEAGGENPENK